MAHVYISYFFKDKPFTDKLAADLRNAGVETWRDVDFIKPGKDWAPEVQQAINNADMLLMVATKNTIMADYLTSELIVARERSTPVVLLVLDDVGFKFLSRSKFSGVDFRADYDAAFQQLLTLLPASVRQAQPVQPEAPKSKGYVFISYAEEDTQFVTQLREFLRQRGYGFWDYQASDRNYQTQLFLELEGI